MVVLVVIVVVALVLIAMAFFNKPLKLQRAKKNAVPSRIDKVREAAFDVIMASLEEEPQKWQVVSTDKDIHWLINRSSQTAIWLASGRVGLFVVDEQSIMSCGQPVYPSPERRLEPPEHMRAELYSMAMTLAKKCLEQNEISQLDKLVASFHSNQRQRRDQKPI